jgi:hypothetical protein
VSETFQISLPIYLFTFSVTTLPSYPIKLLKTTPPLFSAEFPHAESSTRACKFASNGHKIPSLSIILVGKFEGFGRERFTLVSKLLH